MSKINPSDKGFTPSTLSYANELTGTDSKQKTALPPSISKKNDIPPGILVSKVPLPLTQRTVKSASPLVNLTSSSEGTAHLTSLNTLSPLIHQHLITHSFNSALFCSGKGTTETAIIDELAQGLIHSCHSENHTTYFDQVLNELNTLEKTNPAMASQVSFALRTAVLLAAQRTGGPMESWKVYTLPSPDKDKDFWAWIEKPGSWIPEAQALKAKYFQNTFVHSLNLAKKHNSPTVAMLKGGFGAGKTQHINQSYGGTAKGVIGPDTAKNIVRSPIKELNHSRAHLQASDAAFSQFDTLIKQISGTVVYDSSLSRASDVRAYLIKAEQSGKALEIADITRNDSARALAVLSRPVDGDDPRIPPAFVLRGADMDRKQRPDCMNAVLYPSTYTKDINITQQHRYELFGCNAAAADKRLLITIDATGEIQWAPQGDITKKEAINRMQEQGVLWDKKNQQFTHIDPNENWKKTLKTQLEQPVGKLIQSLNPGEKKIRHSVFSQRILPLKASEFTSPAGMYTQLDAQFTACISKEAFIKAFDELDSNKQRELIHDLQIKASQERTLSYLDLPATVALSLHAELKKDPWQKNTA